MRSSHKSSNSPVHSADHRPGGSSFRRVRRRQQRLSSVAVRSTSPRTASAATVLTGGRAASLWIQVRLTRHRFAIFRRRGHSGEAAIRIRYGSVYHRCWQFHALLRIRAHAQPTLGSRQLCAIACACGAVATGGSTRRAWAAGRSASARQYLVHAEMCGLCHTQINRTGIYRGDDFYLAGGMRVGAYPHGVFVSRNFSEQITVLGRSTGRVSQPREE